MKNLLKDKKFLVSLSILFILIIPAILVVLSATWLGQSWIRPVVEEEELSAVYVSPSEISRDKAQYQDKFIVIQGRVTEGDMVCERKECPSDDPCCGCEHKRDLVVSNSGTTVISQSSGNLRLLGPSKESFCQRISNACRYDCGDWQPGEVYELRGTFRTTPPPPGSGLRIYSDSYFEVQEKRLVRTLGIVDQVKSLFLDLKNIIQSTRTSGYYILH
ncbi:MAG TPA: hypothetical protein VMY36_04270 [Patescibacteria group bacterium]|nr:hypothetical protein [Patescibacteria group bacterium]